MHERTVTVDGGGLRLGDRSLPVRSAEVHSWRLDPRHWPRVLDTVVDLGFTCISVYVPWSCYETAPRTFDFDRGARALPRFLDLVGDRGLFAIVRPGPNSGAELENSGWPRRVLDDPDCQARRPDGRGYLLPTATHHAFMPSYASRRTLTEVAGWYDAVVPVLASRQWPDGPVVASHVDNEMGYHFQAHPFALDYHPDAIVQWQEFVGDDRRPPRDGRDGTELDRIAWIRFREHHLRRSLRTLADMLAERGLDRVPLLHNDYPRTTTPFDSGALEHQGVVDVAAGDVYATRQGGSFVRDYARHLAGSSRLPWLAETGSGWLTLPWLLPMDLAPDDAEHVLWRALSGGVRAFNVYMAVERDRWYGAPVSATGQPRPHAAVLRRVNRRLDEVRWHELRRVVPVLVLENRDESRRVAAGSILGDLVPPFRQVLPLDRRLFDGDPTRADAIGAWERGVHAALDGAGVEWDAAVSSSLPDLTTYRAIVVPCVDTLDRTTVAALDAAAARGCVVVCGPAAPTLDADLEPMPSPGWLVCPEPAQVLAALPDGCAGPSAEDGVAVTTLRHGDGRALRLVVNASDRERTLRIDDQTVALAPWSGDIVEVPT